MRRLWIRALAIALVYAHSARAQDSESAALAETEARLLKELEATEGTPPVRKWDNGAAAVERFIAEQEAPRIAAGHRYVQVYLANRQPLLFASAALCHLEGQRRAWQQDIVDERAAARHSGVVDKRVMYEAGQAILEIDKERKGLSAAIKRSLKKPPMPCSNAMVDWLIEQYECEDPDASVCNPDMRGARDHVLGWLRDGLDIRSLEAQLREQVSEEWHKHAEYGHKRVSENLKRSLAKPLNGGSK